MQTKNKIGILSGIMAVAALCTASIAPSALAQLQPQQGQTGYGFIYRNAKSGRWGYVWQPDRFNCQLYRLDYLDSIRKIGDPNFIPENDVVYECQAGTEVEFSLAVADRN